MITQVINKANTCYLKGNNACFTLSGMNEDSGTLKDRIYSRRVALGLSQQQLAEKAGVSQVTIQHLESGRNATSKKLVEIARALNVSAEWLDSGKASTAEPSNVAPAMQPNMSYRYPVVSWVAAGAWAEAVEPFPPGFSDRYEISDYNSKGVAFWLEVKGDSMTSPVGTSITEGMMILVDTEAEAISGKLVVAKLADSNEATFKKLVDDGGRRYLKPLNPAYPVEMCAENCRIVGVVVRAMMKL
ncbi:LexA family transcriptional regulator [Pseudomonas sp. JQ170]|uniref:LexA family protein n=1 Tax=unclassified Pseudomonas TaxID=196821 RepID=UPI0026547016|nr:MULTISPECIES: LexA family transcriptional regulator [unclassified Pseudomonas]MDN7144131.1 LexA family transcriptional regulator [Pseudomonas sp. JQ170]WRO77730.1 LexA family transcriptional regulator [Pseudomonas sp. 170C]